MEQTQKNVKGLFSNNHGNVRALTQEELKLNAEMLAMGFCPGCQTRCDGMNQRKKLFLIIHLFIYVLLHRKYFYSDGETSIIPNSRKPTQD